MNMSDTIIICIKTHTASNFRTCLWVLSIPNSASQSSSSSNSVAENSDSVSDYNGEKEKEQTERKSKEKERENKEGEEKINITIINLSVLTTIYNIYFILHTTSDPRKACNTVEAADFVSLSPDYTQV